MFGNKGAYTLAVLQYSNLFLTALACEFGTESTAWGAAAGMCVRWCVGGREGGRRVAHARPCVLVCLTSGSAGESLPPASGTGWRLTQQHCDTCPPCADTITGATSMQTVAQSYCNVRAPAVFFGF